MTRAIMLFLAVFMALALQTLASAIPTTTAGNITRREEATSARLYPRQSPAWTQQDYDNDLHDKLKHPEWILKNCEFIDGDNICNPGPRLVGQLGCYPKPPHKYKDAHKGDMYQAATVFCNETVTGHRHDRRPIVPISSSDTVSKGFDYNGFAMDITEDTSCDKELEYYNVLHPKGLAPFGADNEFVDCRLIFYWAWRGW